MEPAPTVLFHVGWPKTGTTSLQEVLRSWPNLSGMPFDRTGGPAARALHRDLVWGEPAEGALDRHLRAAVVDPALPVIHSDEACVGGARQWFNGARPPEAIAATLARTALPARVLLTLRSPQPWLRSSYRFLVDSGWAGSYADFLARVRTERGRGAAPFDWVAVADAYDAGFGHAHVALAWFEDLVADPAAAWTAVADRLDLPGLAPLGAQPLPHLNDTRVGPPAVELTLNRWVLASQVRPRRGLRVVHRSWYQRTVSRRLLRRSSDRYFRRAAGEAELVAALTDDGRTLAARYGAAPPPTDR